MGSALAAPDTGSHLPATASLGFLQAAITTFEGVEKLAALMAKMGTMPDHLKDKPADCFRIVVQAAKWGMDPFAVAECTSLVHGRLCWEGKLVAAALRATNAIEGRLTYTISGNGQEASIVVTGTPRGGEPCSLSGTVRDWRTVNRKEGREIPNAWDKDPHSMLVYRGTRQWARIYAPEALLGVSTPDEVEDIRTVDATVLDNVPAAKPAKVREAAVEQPTPAAEKDAEPLPRDAHSAPAQQAPQANATGPTSTDVNVAARELHKEFKGWGTTALKAITKELEIEQISLCPPEKLAKAKQLLDEARANLSKTVPNGVPPKAGA